MSDPWRQPETGMEKYERIMNDVRDVVREGEQPWGAPDPLLPVFRALLRVDELLRREDGP